MKVIVLFSLLFLSVTISAQQSPKSEVENTKDSTKIDYNAVFEYVEEEAEYIGGHGLMFKFIQENLVYPVEISNANDSPGMGRVRVKFVVEKNGTLSQIEVLNDIPEIRKMYLDLFTKMPPWKPAKLNGIIVRQQCFLPINICLN
jgi:hypothetical protein